MIWFEKNLCFQWALFKYRRANRNSFVLEPPNPAQHTVDMSYSQYYGY